jgi:anti-sigma factor RsiW
MTSCQRVGARLDAYHDGELSGFARARVARHLRRCPACRADLEGLTAVGELVRETAGNAPRLDLWTGLAPRLAALDARRRPELLGGSWQEALQALLAPRPARIAALLAVLLLLFVFSLGRPEPQPSEVVQWLSPQAVDHEVVVLPHGAEDPTVIWVTDPEADTGLVRPVSAEGVRVAP